MLTEIQRDELESLGPATVRTKLIHSGAGRGASVAGFKCGDITRGYIEDWLVEKHHEESTIQTETLRWAKIAGWASIVAVIVGVISLWFQK
jgi:hypothetical protein